MPQRLLVHLPQQRIVSVLSDPRHEEPTIGIAPITGRNQIGDVVMVFVSVKMIGNQRPTYTSALHPVDFRLTPMARVRPRADFLVEHVPMFVHPALAVR